jgi:hypothetical protein
MSMNDAERPDATIYKVVMNQEEICRENGYEG